MRKWRIEGVDAETGSQVRTILQAASQGGALVQAKRDRITVTNIVDIEQEEIEQATEEYEARKGGNAASAGLERGEVICSNPNCGQRVHPRKESRANVPLGILLMFFFLIPGILYFLLRSGYQYFCPRCGAQIGSDA